MSQLMRQQSAWITLTTSCCACLCVCVCGCRVLRADFPCACGCLCLSVCLCVFHSVSLCGCHTCCCGLLYVLYVCRERLPSGGRPASATQLSQICGASTDTQCRTALALARLLLEPSPAAATATAAAAFAVSATASAAATASASASATASASASAAAAPASTVASAAATATASAASAGCAAACSDHAIAPFLSACCLKMPVLSTHVPLSCLPPTACDTWRGMRRGGDGEVSCSGSKDDARDGHGQHDLPGRAVHAAVTRLQPRGNDVTTTW